MMKLIYLLAQIIGFIFPKPAPPKEEEVERSAAEIAAPKPEIDPRIRELRDVFVPDVFYGRWTAWEHSSPNIEVLLDNWSKRAARDRAHLHRMTGSLLPAAEMHGVAFTAGRCEFFSCRFEFRDLDPETTIAVPCGEDVERLLDLDKRLKRFLN